MLNLKAYHIQYTITFLCCLNVFSNLSSLIMPTAFFVFSRLSQDTYNVVSSRRNKSLEGGTIFSDYVFKERSLIPLSQ